jgi:hypothetical protein
VAFWLESDHLTSCFSSSCVPPLPLLWAGTEPGEEGGAAKLAREVAGLIPCRLGARIASLNKQAGVRGLHIALGPVVASQHLFL